MDPIKAEKLQAMKKYKKNNHFFSYNLILHFLAGVGFSLLLSYAFWFPCLVSSTKQFLLISLPCIWSSFFNPKCLFIVVNVIVIFLVGESRLLSTNSSPAPDIYNEYLERSRSLRGNPVSTPQEKKRVQEIVEKEAQVKKIINMAEGTKETIKEEDGESVHQVNQVTIAEATQVKQEDTQVQGMSEIVEKEEEEEEAYEQKEREIVQEETELPAEELNKRVEEFIARINKQMWLEAQLSVCCSA